MATFTNRANIDKIIAADGWDSPKQAVKIVEYENAFNGATCWGVIYDGDRPDRYNASDAIRNPRTIWIWKGLSRGNLYRHDEAGQG